MRPTQIQGVERSDHINSHPNLRHRPIRNRQADVPDPSRDHRPLLIHQIALDPLLIGLRRHEHIDPNPTQPANLALQ